MPPSLTSTTSVSTPEPMRAASRPPISLPSARGGQHHTGGRCGLDKRCQHVHERGDQVVVRVVGLGDVDLGRACGLQAVGETVGQSGLADDDGRRLAQSASGGDQFSGDLLRGTVSVLDEHKYFSHEFYLWVFRVSFG